MKSIGQKIMRLEGLHDTRDVSEWENGFIESIVIKTDHGKHTAALSEKQIEIIARLYGKHFA
jgi:hypothetical protein